MGNVFDLDKFKSKQQPATPVAGKVPKRTTEPFAIVPLRWIERVAWLTRSPTTLVVIELLYASWKAESATFPLPANRLKQLGVGRNVTRKVLLDLEGGRVIAVQRLPRRAPIITLLETIPMSRGRHGQVTGET